MVSIAQVLNDNVNKADGLCILHLSIMLIVTLPALLATLRWHAETMLRLR